jgi:cytochrome b561
MWTPDRGKQIMRGDSPAPAWTRLARGFHWGTLLLVLIQIPLGFWMVDVYETYAETYADDTWVMRTSLLHHTIGFLILSVTLSRFIWRARNPAPSLPANLASYQRNVARLTHYCLYLLLIIYPLSGWASLSAYEGEFPIFFFAWESVPRIVPQVAEDAFFNYELFAEIHRYCWRIGAVLLSLHIIGALWHHYVARDNVLRRMWSGQ